VRLAVRQDSALQEAATGCRHPWERPAQWSLPEKRPDEARDAVRACWERLVPAPGDALMEVRVEVQQEAGIPILLSVHVLQIQAKADADRKESVLAWEPVEQAVPGSECRGARPEALRDVLERAPFVRRHFRKRAGDAGARIEEAEEEQAPCEPRVQRAAGPPLPVHAWPPSAGAMIQWKPAIRVLPALRLPATSCRAIRPSQAIRSLPRPSGA